MTTQTPTRRHTRPKGGPPPSAASRARTLEGRQRWIVPAVLVAVLAVAVSLVWTAHRSDQAQETTQDLASRVQAVCSRGGEAAAQLGDTCDRATEASRDPVAGPEGPEGPAGAAGPAGPAGAAGEPGASIIGPSGAAGQPGAPGTPGPAGEPGEAGAAGASGAPGPSGEPGGTGPAGEPGPAGPSGEPGPSGSPPESFTFVGPLGTRYTCTPDGPAGPGTSPNYTCRS